MREAEHQEEVFVGFLDAHTGCHADFERTDIEAGAGAVGRHETLVKLDGLDTHLAEEIFGYGLHQQAFGAAADALSIFFQAEYTAFTVLAAEGLEALADFLTVVQGGGGYMNIQILGVGNLYRAPFAVLEVTADVEVRLHISERQSAPINFIFHFYSL